MVEQAMTDLDGYKQAAGAFFEDITAGELPADAFVASLDGHTSTVFVTIDALTAGTPRCSPTSAPPPSTCPVPPLPSPPR